MVKIYVARQPILDREGKIFAYELLFRSGFKNKAEFGENDGVRCTARVIESVMSSYNLGKIIRDKKGFINIDETSEILNVAELLPPDRIGFEVLESAILSTDFLNTLKRLKELGYELSLDDFVYSEEFIPYLELVDYVKIDVLEQSEEEVREILPRLEKYGVKLVAEKVETYELFKTYLEMGFHYFQGFFFQKPKIVVSKTVEPAYAALVQLYNMVAEERDVKDIERVFKKFSELSVKLLQLINSAYYSLRQPVKSIRHAVLMLGYQNLLKWILLLMYSVRSEDFTSDPLFEEASIRGFFMEKLADFLFPDKETPGKAFIVGILSLVDVLLSVPMEEVVEHLSLEEDIREALVSRKGKLGGLLTLVEKVQKGNLANLEELLSPYKEKGLTPEKLLQLHTEAIKEYSEIEF
ncbi:EAL and modified HD-GYP domain-containing signal transduction protein [Hydrogenivirga caldilitoris]|uniref:EAL and modified HD-GYP domain-containing signal transduction protein n=1 Tax=Hydrogenivirga caldilitoris TaxID=246264 RepID=A0A497XLX7_9AQUI|nr:EAL domain-containing protein [Hydrogenivirga caldilitoris]RLJ69788.1 EAL and modified HD-GYP domain-containing signal transduction protein [Hydrogenivirga caldilitoris]